MWTDIMFRTLRVMSLTPRMSVEQGRLAMLEYESRGELECAVVVLKAQGYRVEDLGNALEVRV